MEYYEEQEKRFGGGGGRRGDNRGYNKAGTTYNKRGGRGGNYGG